MKTRIALLAKIIVSVLLLIWVISRIDIGNLIILLGKVEWYTVLLAILIIEIQTILLSWRWTRIVYLLGGQLSFALAARLTFFGVFMNQVLPTSIGGDVIRVWGMHRHDSKSGISFSSVVIERLTGMLALSMMITACILMMWGNRSDPLIGWIMLISVPVILVVLIVASAADKLPCSMIPKRIQGLISSVSHGLRRLGGNPIVFFELMALGGIASIIGLFSVFILGIGLNINVAFPVYIALVGSAILISSLPISLGGWGVRESAMIGLFGFVGVPEDKSLLLSILFGIVLFIASLPGGLAWWAWHSVSVKGNFAPMK
jgi:uncharacterized protein (TIRG00374 family)